MTMHSPYRLYFVLKFTLLATFWAAHYGYSQTISHTVTVQVNSVALLQSSGTVSAVIGGTGIAAGSNVLSATSQTSTLLWATNRGAQKITARLSSATPFLIFLKALNPTTGVASSEFLVDVVAKDILLNIGKSQGSAILSYTITIGADKGIVSDNPLILFEMINQ